MADSNDILSFRLCKLCRQILPRDEFAGNRSQCKKCRRKRQKEIESAREFKDQKNARRRTAAGRSAARRLWWKNRDKILADISTAEYKAQKAAYDAKRNAKPDIKARKRELEEIRLSDPQKKRQRQQTAAIRERRPDIRIYRRVRHAIRRDAPGTVTPKDIQDLLLKQRRRCAICRLRLGSYHVDHIVPIARGGTNDRRNLQILCPPCNLTKAAKDPIEHMRSLGRLL